MAGIVACPGCGCTNDLEPHFDGKLLTNFTCRPCGLFFTWAEGTGSQPANETTLPATLAKNGDGRRLQHTTPKGKDAMPNRDDRERALLESTAAEKKVSRFLICDLTHDEQRERGHQLAQLTQDIEALEAELKRVKGEINARILEAKTKHSHTKQAVLTRREHREVTCTEHYDYKKALVYVVRDDLGLITETRPMTASERQQPLPVDHMKTTQGDKADEHKNETTSTRARGAKRATAGASAPA